MKTVSGKEFAKVLEKQGWVLRRVKGSHHIYYHPDTKEFVSVPVHGNKDLKRGLQRGLMKDAAITEDML